MEGTATSKLSTPDPEEDTVALGDTERHQMINQGGDTETIVMGINKLSLQDLQRQRHRSNRESELIINQSDLSRHGGRHHSALNEEFIDMKNRRVNFSSKKQDLGKMMDHHFSGFNTSLPLTFKDEERDSGE